MATLSFPWTGTSPGQAGPYSAAQFAAFQQQMFNRHANPADSFTLAYSNPTSIGIPAGTIIGFGNDVEAAAVPAMSVLVGAGAGVINGTWVEHSTKDTLVIGANSSGNPRIDTVVVHIDNSLQTAVIQVNQGTPAGSPNPPGMVQSAGAIWEVPLADIAVANGAVSITNANITPRNVYANAPDAVIIPVLNNSPGVLQTGDVVVWDTSAAQAVKSSTTVFDPTVAGVMIGRTPSAAIGQMLVRGVGWVNTDGAVGIGNFLIQGSTARQAHPVTAYTSPNNFGYCLNATGGAGFVVAYIDATRIGASNSGWAARGRQLIPTYQNSGTDYALTTATTWTNIDTTNMAVVITPQSTRVLLVAYFDLDLTSGACDICFDWFNNTTSTRSQAGNLGTLRTVTGGATTPVYQQTCAAYFTGLTPGTQYTFYLQYFKNLGSINIHRNGYPILVYGQEY